MDLKGENSDKFFLRNNYEKIKIQNVFLKGVMKNESRDNELSRDEIINRHRAAE
jgi:hypothetical protein